MLALDASFVVRHRASERLMAAKNFFTTYLTTALEPDELLTELRVPALPPRTGSAFLEISRRHGDFAIVAAGALVTLDEAGTMLDPRLVLTGVGPTPIRLGDVESGLRRQPAEPEVFREACGGIGGSLDPDDDVHATAEYRRDMAAVLARRSACPGGRSRPGTVRMTETHHFRVNMNGRDYEAEVEPRLLLVDFLRDHLGLTGTHVGCEHGVCGACTILWDGEPVRSCLLFAVQAHRAELRTVEGLAPGPTKLHPIQQAFHEAHALQCGFCTPGFLLTVEALLRENPHPSESEIRQGLSGNLCRCTGYQNIVDAVKLAAERLEHTAG